MKIETNLDPWGGIRLELKGESSHENTLLRMLGMKRICEDHSTSDQGSTDGPTQTILTLTFRERESIQGQAGPIDAKTATQ